MNSLTEENYLKIIYKLLESADVVHTNDIARKAQTRAASVTDMLRKLAAKKYINYRKYNGLTLTPEGKKVALNIIRKHRLWEMFLVEKLGFSWDEVHDVAEQLEHIHSDKLIDQVEKSLNYPRFDPHGDPIPDRNGKITPQKSILLSHLRKNESCLMSGVIDHSKQFLQHLDRLGIALGNEIKIKEVVDYDKSLYLVVNKKTTLYISSDVARNILVTKQ
ncbi:MAG: metal-dependent transcriptional regulator [Bacteroidota bacterium]